MDIAILYVNSVAALLWVRPMFVEVIHSNTNSMNRHITLDPCYALAKARLTFVAIFAYFICYDALITRLDRLELQTKKHCLDDVFYRTKNEELKYK